MTITHDADQKAFERGQLAGEMKLWYRDKPVDNPPLSLPEILFHLKYIHEQLASMQKQTEFHTAQQHFQAAEDRLRELIERVK